jgi:hypothetical protein
VYVYETGTFTKTGGTIYGDTDTTHTAGSDENTATGGDGHAVYYNVSPIAKKRHTTLGPGDNISPTNLAANWD